MLADSGKDAIDELIPALIQCFGVIFLGYLAGRYQVLCETQIRGLNAYVTKFALPAVFFKGMVTVDLSGVSWFLVGAISLGKALVFLLVFGTTVLLERHAPFGVASILAMFVSQSNDIALGYPVLKALYPELAIYVYLVAPVQLVILNPIAYTFLEWHQLKQHIADRAASSLTNGAHSTSPTSVNKYKRFLQVIWRVMMNPLFFMTIIGVLFNFILQHRIPYYVDGLLKIIADSFAATALFTLGFGMVGKMGRITHREILILFVILMIKLVILPFINRELVVHLVPVTQLNETLNYSTFGFLYGAIPTAPPVYLFAVQYQILPVVTGIGLVLGTFLCAPMMFILARMVTMYTAVPSNYDQLLGSTVVDISWISIACCIWTLLILLLSRKAFRVPHRFTCCYLICILLSCIGVAIGNFLNGSNLNRTESTVKLADQPANAYHYLQFTTFFIGCTGTRFWATLIAFAMFLERFRSVCYVLRIQAWIYLIGFSLPVLVTSILLCTSSKQRVKDVDPAFQYGIGQLIVSLIVLLINMFGTLLFTILYVRLGALKPPSTRRYCNFMVAATQEKSEEATPVISSSVGEVADEFDDQQRMLEEDISEGRSQPSVSTPFCSCVGNEFRRHCIRRMTQYERLCRLPASSSSSGSNDGLTPRSARPNVAEFQHLRHVVLLFFLLTTIFFGICLCTWRLVREAPSGLYLVLEFLDGTFNFGQGIALFIIFGLDADLILDPIRRVVCRLWHRLPGVTLDGTEISISGTSAACLTNEQEIAHQFVTYHINSCASTIAKDAVYSETHVRVFTEDALKLWLCESGLTHREAEATEYVTALMTEGVVAEIWTHDLSSGSDIGLESSRLLFFTNRVSPSNSRTSIAAR